MEDARREELQKDLEFEGKVEGLRAEHRKEVAALELENRRLRDNFETRLHLQRESIERANEDHAREFNLWGRLVFCATILLALTIVACAGYEVEYVRHVPPQIVPSYSWPKCVGGSC
jgi:hypothetical protein